MTNPAPGKTLSMTQVLLCGAAIVTLSMGIRHGFGLWLQPITQAQDWSRQTFSFASMTSAMLLPESSHIFSSSSPL